jgi:hypothetical protein
VNVAIVGVKPLQILLDRLNILNAEFLKALQYREG